MYICSSTFEFVSCVFKQKTAYELRISDWSSDVCSSDLALEPGQFVIPLDVSRLAIAEGTLGAIGCLRLAFARHTDGRRGPGDAADSGQLQEVPALDRHFLPILVRLHRLTHSSIRLRRGIVSAGGAASPRQPSI